MDNTTVTKLESFGNRGQGDILAIQTQVRPYPLVSRALSLTALRTLAEIGRKRMVILAQDISSEAFLAPKESTISQFFVRRR